MLRKARADHVRAWLVIISLHVLEMWNSFVWRMLTRFFLPLSNAGERQIAEKARLEHYRLDGGTPIYPGNVVDLI